MVQLLSLMVLAAGPSAAGASTPAPEATVRFLHHSAATVETARHVLVFDYADVPVALDLGRLRGRKLVVFVSHGHGDHLSPEIFEWARHGPVHYVLAQHALDAVRLPPEVGLARGNLTVVGPDQVHSILDPPLRVRTTASTDAGVMFWVEVDGLSVLHTGDHALWAWGEAEYEASAAAYLREIDKLVALRQPLDVALVCADLRPSGRARLSGAPLAVERLRPALVMALHNDAPGSPGAAAAALALREVLAGRPETIVADVKRHGDAFTYRRAPAR